MPAFAARLKVKQGWGEAGAGVILNRIGYANASYDEDFAYAVALGGKFNLDALSAGSNIAVNGFYTKGAFGWVGITDSSLLGDVSMNGGQVELNEAMGISASVKYALASNLWTTVSGGYAEFDDNGSANNDYDLWQASFEVGYKPVKNLKVIAAVQYTETSFDRNSNLDTDDWEGKIRFQRDF